MCICIVKLIIHIYIYIYIYIITIKRVTMVRFDYIKSKLIVNLHQSDDNLS